MIDSVVRVAAFCAGSEGGNPAGVWIGPALPAASRMQEIAAAIGYSETVFAAPVDTAPVDTAPFDAVAVDTVPVDTVPVDTAAVDTAAVDTEPVATAARDTAAVDTAAVDTAPVDTTALATAALDTEPVATAALDTEPVATVARDTAPVAPPAAGSTLRERAAGTWRVRYFSPESEVPFCGHATIALGAVLALRNGDGTFALTTNHVSITVRGARQEGGIEASLQSPPTSSAPASGALVDEALRLFGYSARDLDPRLPPALANGGAGHLILALASRTALAAMRYDLAAGRTLMRREDLATIILVHAESAQRFHARNPFASGGVYEDPATGAGAAALAGYLRDIGWPHGGAIDIVQGEDMGVPCRLHVDIGPEPGSSVQVSGSARLI